MTRDWRIRMIVPVILIHGFAFSVLYYFAYRLLLDELIEAYQVTSSAVVEEVADVFESGTAHAGREYTRRRIADLARLHKGVGIDVFNGSARLVFSSLAHPDLAADGNVRRTLASGDRRPIWSEEGSRGSSLSSHRAIPNDEHCRSCHSANQAVLGAIRLHVDLTPVISAARQRLLLNLGILIAIWGALVFATTRLRQFVVGRPLARIRESLRHVQPTAHVEPSENESDLDRLARELNNALWVILRKDERQRTDVARQMARAEQLAALGSVAAGLSHEIRNPLAGIRAAIEALRSEPADRRSDAVPIFNQILAELDRVTHTVSGLLRLARPQAPSRMPVRLEQVVRNVVTLFEPQLRGRHVWLDVDAASDVPTLELDSNLVTQLLVNLLTNASQAVGEGGKIRVTVGAFPRGDGAIVSVTDNGSGISAAQVERIFEPFFTTKPGGTGLGLPICRQIVDQHGGSIRIESTPGEGTRVVVLLPSGGDGQREVGFGTDHGG